MNTTQQTTQRFSTRLLSELAAERDGMLHPEDTLHTAGERMRTRHASVWPVVEGLHLIGMIEGANPDWRAARYGHDPDDTYVRDIMNRDIVYCYDDQDCAAALQLMNERHLDCLPVVDHESKIVGIVSSMEMIEKSSSARIGEEDDIAAAQAA